MLISVNGVKFSYGGNLILNDVAFTVNEGERVALVGANGEGKTTLIKVMLGALYPDFGEVIKKNGARIGWLEQNGGLESGNTVYGEMISVFSEELRAVKSVAEIAERLSHCQKEDFAALSQKMESLENYIAAHDAYNVEVKVKTVLNGMGFNGRYEQIINTMSGGEKTKLKLCKLLLEEPDLLVLDEPTNHLDVKTLFWLEDYLAAFNGAVFVVSHDRYFLDRVTARTLELENKKLLSFSGNYSKYKILKAERDALLLKEYEKQREEIEKLETYVAKNIVRATTAKSAQSRVKKLEKIEVVEKPFTPSRPPKYKFEYDTPPYESVLNIRNLNLEIGGKRLICGGQLTLKRGKKLALTGENGTGKSTLLKEIIAGGNPAIEVGRQVAFAYYDQENANLGGDNTVLEELWGRHVAYSASEARAALARCGLSAEDADKKVKELSGGERAKLGLCVFENERGNVLVLDEPTNHLDLPARESLENALKEFDGTVIFVSHDRYFISAVCDCVAEIDGGKLIYYDGGYADFKRMKDEAEAQAKQAEKAAEQEIYKEKKQAFYRSAKERADEARRKNELKATENAIAETEEKIEKLNESLTDTSVTSDYAKLKSITDEIAELNSKLEDLYTKYGNLI